MNIITKQVKDLTQVEYRACYAANYGYDGYMRDKLIDARRWPVDEPATAILIWDGPPDTVKSLKAWALLTPTTLSGITAGSRYTKRKAKYTAQFWVKKQYRRQGLGTLLMTEVKKFDQRPHVFPHDEPSGEMFSKYNVTVQKYDRVWMKRKPKVA